MRESQKASFCYIPITNILSNTERSKNTQRRSKAHKLIGKSQEIGGTENSKKNSRRGREIVKYAIDFIRKSYNLSQEQDTSRQSRRVGSETRRHETSYAKRKFPHLISQFYGNVQREVIPQEHEPLKRDSLVGKIIYQRYGGLLEKYPEPPRYIEEFVGGVHNDKSVSGIWLPDGQYLIVKTGNHEEIMRELRGNQFMRQYAIGKYMPIIRFTHIDPFLVSGMADIPKGKGYIISDWITDYESVRDLEKSEEIKPNQAISFIDEYTKLNSEMWDKNKKYYDLEPNLENSDFYSMQRREWEDVKKTSNHNLQRLADLLGVREKLNVSELTEEQVNMFKQSRIRIKIKDGSYQGFHWEEYASYAEIEKNIDEANKERIACLVAGNNDMSFKNVLKDRPFNVSRKLKYMRSKFGNLRNFWIIDTEMVGYSDLAENFAVMGKGKSPALADEVKSHITGVTYNAEANTIDIDKLNIHYSRVGLAVEEHVLNTLIPLYASRYGIELSRLRRDYMMRRANNEIHAMTHLSGKKDPMMILQHLLEAGMWLSYYENTVRDPKYVAKIA